MCINIAIIVIIVHVIGVLFLYSSWIHKMRNKYLDNVNKIIYNVHVNIGINIKKKKQ